MQGLWLTGKIYVKRTERLLLQLWPQGAHKEVPAAAFFLLHWALQTLPVTGWEPGMHGFPHRTLLWELLTSAGGGQSLSPDGFLPAAPAGWLEARDPLLRAPFSTFSSFPFTLGH